MYQQQTYNPLGPNPALQGNIPLEFNNRQAYADIQQEAQANAGAARQGFLDNTSRFPGTASGQQTGLRYINRDIADQSLRAQSGLQLQGMREGLADRRQAQQYGFQNEQNKAQQEFQKFMQQGQFNQQNEMWWKNNKQAENDKMFNLFKMAVLGA